MMYEAIIKFELNDDSLTMDEIDDALFEVGFDDAIISHSGDGKIAIEMCREAANHESLVALVVEQVTVAIPSARLFQVSDDSRQISQSRNANSFKLHNLVNLGVDVSASRIRSKIKHRSISEIKQHEKLNIDTLINKRGPKDDRKGGNIIDIPDDKKTPHPAQYFKDLYLHKLRAQKLSDKELIMSLDLSYEQFECFLNEKMSVTITFAKSLELVTGMPSEFWLRAQMKFDNSHK